MRSVLQEKQCLLQKIAENRAELRYEFKVLKASLSPTRSLLAFGKHAGPVIVALAALARSLLGGGRKRNSRRLNYASLIPVLIPLLRLVLERRGNSCGK